jgi:anti-sigma B factor antagonist
MPDLKIDVRQIGNISIVEPVGYINAHTAKNFENVLQDLVEKKQNRIVINCRGLEYVASAGLGVIMGFIDTIRDDQGDIRMCNINETVRNIFDVLGFTQLYSIFDTEDGAVTSFRDVSS